MHVLFSTLVEEFADAFHRIMVGEGNTPETELDGTFHKLRGRQRTVGIDGMKMKVHAHESAPKKEIFTLPVVMRIRNGERIISGMGILVI